MDKESIIIKLKEKESEYGINIIYAWLGGSRNCNIHTEDSDYDIFFVYEGITNKYGMNSRSDCNCDCNYGIVGVKYSRFLFSVSSGERKYALDNIRASTIYISNKKFITECYNLALTVDYTKFLLTFKRAIKQIYAGNYPITTKTYKKMLMFAMRYLWVEANQLCMYPVDTHILLEYFIDESWYNSAKYVLNYSDKNLVLQNSSDLITLFENIIEVI